MLNAFNFKQKYTATYNLGYMLDQRLAQKHRFHLQDTTVCKAKVRKKTHCLRTACIWKAKYHRTAHCELSLQENKMIIYIFILLISLQLFLPSVYPSCYVSVCFCTNCENNDYINIDSIDMNQKLIKNYNSCLHLLGNFAQKG